MDGVQGRVVRFRAPGVPEADTRDEADEPGYRDRPMPVAASILWQPADGAAPQGTLTIPIFITQRALAAVHDHCAATREVCFGLLTGNLFRSPDTGAPYLVVESTIRLPAGAADDAKTALVQGWVVAQDVLRRTDDQLVGWYRGGAAATATLSPAEAEMHAALFAQPWQVAVAVDAGGDASAGSVLRPSAGDGWARQGLPFYELLEQASIQPDGTKRTRLHWTNYRTDQATFLPADRVAAPPPSVAPAPPAVHPAPRPAPLVFLPDQFGPGPGAPPFGAKPLNAALRFPRGRAARFAAYGAAGLLAIAGLSRLYSGRTSPASPASPASLAPPAPPVPSPAVPETVVATPPERLGRAADTLSLAIAAFDLRARLFASRQMQCPELARGLVLVEERWASYNRARKDSDAPLDSARTARDRALYADADAVERRFERSGCPRP